MGYDPYREEASKFSQMFVLGAAFVAGLIVHALISPHLGGIAALAVAVASGLTFEVLLILVVRRYRDRRGAPRLNSRAAPSDQVIKQRPGSNQKSPCPCCGYRTLDHPDFYDLCPICFWEDDPKQRVNPDSADGANAQSLNQSRQVYASTGAMAREFSSKVRRPTPDEAEEKAQRLG